MKACLLHSPARVETNPLEFTDVPDPVPQGDQVLVRVSRLRSLPHGLTCGRGRTAAAQITCDPGAPGGGAH